MAAAITADAATHGIMAVDVTTAVDANFLKNGLEGIFGCPSCHGCNPTMIETLKLFLPYFPLHIQKLIHNYLKFTEFMHTFQILQNMMNHMEEYQAMFQLFEGTSHKNGSTMPDLSSLQKFMEGGDLIDEFTYVEESSSPGRHGS